MDYIQEELRRQREALAAVLLGGGVRQAPENSREVSRLFTGALSPLRSEEAEQAAAETAPGSAGIQRLRFAAEDGTAGKGGAPAAFGGGPAEEGAAGPRAETAAAAAESGGAAPVPGGGRTAAESVPQEARRSPGASAAERTVTELVYPAGGAAVTAESLSRAFQRDARRYDGGFTPY